MNGPGPKQEGAVLDVMDNLVICKCRHSTAVHGMRGCYACECAENLHSLYTTNIAALRSHLSEQADLIDRLTREKKAMADMLNVQQARAQVAAQSTAKIAQELQIWLKEQAADVV